MTPILVSAGFVIFWGLFYLWLHRNPQIVPGKTLKPIVGYGTLAMLAFTIWLLMLWYSDILPKPIDPNAGKMDMMWFIILAS